MTNFTGLEIALVAYFVVHLGIIVWAISDRQPWGALVVFLFPVIGDICYVIYRAATGPPGASDRQGTKGGHRYRECSHCKEDMRADASVCPRCRKSSRPWRFHEGVWWLTANDGTQHWFDERSNKWVAWESSGNL